MELGQFTAEDLVSAYIAIRDAKRDAEANLAKIIKEYGEQLEAVEHAIIALCKEIGADSIKTPHGIAMRSVKTRYTTNDWESFYNLVHEYKAFDLLERRIHQGNMKSFLEENPDEHPAGLNIDRSYTVTVRKPSK